LFTGCTSLATVAFCDNPGVTDTIRDAFPYNVEFVVTIPDSVTRIRDQAFRTCRSLTSITIPDSVTEIGNCAFSCTSLRTVTIPDSVTEIAEGAFYDCASLTTISIPDSVTQIGDYAFEDCTSLTSVTIPDSVTEIGEEAFENCRSLATVTVRGRQGVTDTIRNAFPNNVEFVEQTALHELRELKAALVQQATTFNESKLQAGQVPSLEVCAQLRGRQQQAELLVHPDAAIYPQLQLEVQAAGLVVSAHFGGEAIAQAESFEDYRECREAQSSE